MPVPRPHASGAHTQATEFFTVALERGGPLDKANEAELLELLAWEFYLIDRLGDAITACHRAMRIRQELGESAAVSANHHSLAVYQWYNANRELAEGHAAEAMSVLDADSGDAAQLVQLGHAFAMQAFLAVQASDLDRAKALITRAREIADTAADSDLTIRVRLIENYGVVLNGDSSGRDEILTILNSGPKHIDELYSGGWSNLTYFDVEQRRLDVAAELLDVTIPLMQEHDLPICRVWQMGSRARLQLMVGEWDDAAAEADRVLEGPSAPLARTWPLLIRALVDLRKHGMGRDSLDDAWKLACRFGEPIRMLPVAAAIVELCWTTGESDDRISECRELLTGGPDCRAGMVARRVGGLASAVGGQLRRRRRGRAVPVAARREIRGGGRRFPPSFHAVRRARSPLSTPAIPRSPHGRWTSSTGSVPTRSQPRFAAICGRRACPRCPRAGVRRRWPTRPV